MDMPKQTISIDINDRKAQTVRAISNVNDSGTRFVDVKLYADNAEFDITGCTVTATFVTDGFLVAEDVACTISGNIVTVPIDSAAIISRSGIMSVELKIADESGNVISPPFAFKVRVTPSIMDDAQISKKSVGTVAEILKEVAAARGEYDNLGERLTKTAAALAEKADKSTTIAGYGITDAYNNSETNFLLSKKADNIFSSQDNFIEQTLSGNVSGSFLSEYSGSEQENTNFEHTAKIPCTAGDEFKVTASYGYHAPLAVFYNEDESFNSYYLLNTSELVTATDEIIEAPVGAAYVAFNNYTPNSVLSVSKNNPVLVTVKEKITENAEKISANSEEISGIKSKITTKADNIYSNDSRFEDVSVTVVQGRYARYDNGTYTESSSLECSEPIACNTGDVFRVTSVYGFSAPLAVFYDSDGNFIGYFKRIDGAWKENTDAEIVTVPENAASVVFNNLSTKTELIIEKGVPISLKEQIENNTADIAVLGKSLLYGKTIYCDGDSVAYGAGSGGYSYCDFIAENNGMKMTKKAVSGTTFAVREGRADSIYERISALCSSGTEYDYILLEGGFNDMFNQIAVGSISDSDYSGGYDTSTSAGAFEQICYLLKTTFPETKILFVLGHRILRGSCDTKQLPYWEIYRKICEKWSIPYVDLARESGLIGWADDETGYAINDTYFQISSSTGHGDGTHPLKEAYEKFYVPLIEANLKTL